jgi:hypothetical protein
LIPNARLLARLSQVLEELLTTNIIEKNSLAPDPRFMMGQIAPGYLMRMRLSRHVFLGLVPQPNPFEWQTKLVRQVQLR